MSDPYIPPPPDPHIPPVDPGLAGQPPPFDPAQLFNPQPDPVVLHDPGFTPDPQQFVFPDHVPDPQQFVFTDPQQLAPPFDPGLAGQPPPFDPGPVQPEVYVSPDPPGFGGGGYHAPDPPGFSGGYQPPDPPGFGGGGYQPPDPPQAASGAAINFGIPSDVVDAAQNQPGAQTPWPSGFETPEQYQDGQPRIDERGYFTDNVQPSDAAPTPAPQPEPAQSPPAQPEPATPAPEPTPSVQATQPAPAHDADRPGDNGIDSKMTPGEVRWLENWGPQTVNEGVGGWAQGFPDVAPSVSLQQDPTDPSHWTISVNGTRVADVETPGGGAPAVGMMRDDDRLQILVNLPPGGTMAESAAPITRDIDIYPFVSHRADTSQHAPQGGTSPEPRSPQPESPPQPGPGPGPAPGHEPGPTPQPGPGPGQPSPPDPSTPGGLKPPPDVPPPQQPTPQQPTPQGPGPQPGPPPVHAPNLDWVSKGGTGAHVHSPLAKDPPATPAPAGPVTPPPPRLPKPPRPKPTAAQLGTHIHRLLLGVLSLRLTMINQLHGVELLTEPRGSKNVRSNRPGRVDLTLFKEDFRHPGSHVAQIYDLKPNNPAEYQDYTSEVHHYIEHFPDEVPAAKLRPPRRQPLHISQADFGQDLRILATVVPGLLAPITISGPGIEVTFRMFLPRGTEGLIVYQLDVRPKRPGEDDNVQRVVNLLRTAPHATAGAQMRIQMQLGLAEALVYEAGIGAAVGATAGLILLGGHLLVGSTAVGAVGAEGAAGAGMTTGGVAGTTAAGGAVAGGAAAAAPTAAELFAAIVRSAPGVANDVANEAAAVILGLAGYELASDAKR